ncbi:MarR family winged helix-turn-helix transcriptional regulator [Streptomyces halstedii]|uniref:MarR family winged helix-turn-helix transcriptional regulator n=1 Tax=Streptomyces TaxID=1883 RepID=UPI0008055804|nr:MarR family transcriptional regulator [Streptomyces sp. OspMP-M45]MYR71246.1 MarR family transcriptional regulator [Streptomyces sp. SID4925]SBV02406.1 DNA-binding transcriptional regulator, MarR family [Streptomyces sp. OspMP-M45]
MTTQDPTELPDPWQSLHTLLAAMEAEIEQVHIGRGIEGVRPRFVRPLIRLAHTGPLTVRELAESLDRTHSAVSQTVAAMRKEELVTSEPGPDARTRRIDLTERGRSLVPFLEAEWRATHAAVAELDGEGPYALTSVVDELRRSLERRSMRQRVLDHLVPPR